MPSIPKSHEQRRREAQQVPNQNKESRERYEREKRQTNPELSAAKKVRSSAKWRAIREMCLKRSPLCQDPFGIHARDHRPTAATEVDHIVPIVQAPDRIFDLFNLQSLCTSCHARKSGQERSEKRKMMETITVDLIPSEPNELPDGIESIMVDGGSIVEEKS